MYYYLCVEIYRYLVSKLQVCKLLLILMISHLNTYDLVMNVVRSYLYTHVIYTQGTCDLATDYEMPLVYSYYFASYFLNREHRGVSLKVACVECL